MSAPVPTAARIILWLRRGRLVIKSLADRRECAGNTRLQRIWQRRPRRGAVASTAQARSQARTVQPVARAERHLHSSLRLLDEEHAHLDPAQADGEIDQVFGI